jgi:CxxC motif-containing protein (DUF1111 family)
MKVWLALLAALAGCIAWAANADRISPEALSAGDFSISRFDRSAFSEPAAVLDAKQRQLFMVGRNVFHRQWASVVSLNGDWGLGPTFVADRCSACHINVGRGMPPRAPGEQLLSMLVRVSLPGRGEHGGPRPHPAYGDQLQNRSLDGSHVDLAYGPERVPAEADVYLDWEEISTTFADGESMQLRKPRLRVENLQFGPLGEDVMLSLRIAQPIYGLGLFDAVPEESLLALARSQRAGGFNGRPNYVWDSIGKRQALGRYGWKANQASLKEQTAAAALGDMGLNSTLFPEQNCPPPQQICARTLPGNFPEIINYELDALVVWLRGLAVPVRREVDAPAFRRGEALFVSAQCAVCHVPELKTATRFPALPQLANQVFRAYTDLLLHDMGEDLADGRPDYRAGPRDWRTPALWGLGLSETVSGALALLHDGRARGVAEAILWHGGEAQAAKEVFRAMPKADREALVKFVESI